MYSPQTIEIQNIGTIENLVYNFSIGESFIIQGKNLDNKGQKNNGVGKSFFIDSIGFAISGIILSGRSVDDFIRDGENEGSITFTLIDNVNNNMLKITRILNRKKPQVIEIYKNDIPIHKNDADVNARNQTIINEIGISKDDLFQFFLISKDRYKPYFKISDTEKKEITNRFSNANSIDGVFDVLANDISENDLIYNALDKEITSIKAKIDTYDLTIEELKNSDSVDKKQQLKDELNILIKEHKNTINEIDSNILEQMNELSDFEKDILLLEAEYDKNNNTLISLEKIKSNLKSELNNIESELDKSLSIIEKDILLVEEERNKLQKQQSETNKLLFEINSTKLEIENQLKSKIECPSCNYEFILSSDFTIDELKVNLEEVEVLLKSTQETLDYCNNKINKTLEDKKKLSELVTETKGLFKETTNEINLKINQNNSKIEEINLLLNNLNKNKINKEASIVKINSSIEINKNKIESINKLIEDKNKSLADVDKSNNEENIKKFTELKDQLLTSLSEKENDFLLVEENKRELNEWVLKFKAFKSYLANLSIKNIEDLINFYLNQMNTDLSIEIEGYKQTGKKVVEKITETILRGGEKIGRYTRFSGGERTRIDVASILANQTLINNNVSPKGLDLIIIDEVLESLDGVGLENIIDSMENINKTMVMVTQNEINHNNVITFVKQNGTVLIQ